MDCVFCKIIRKELPSKILYEDERCIVIEDLNPQAPFHALAIPKEHIEKAGDIDGLNGNECAHIFEIIAKLMTGKDFRIIVNSGKGAGQTVMHLHFHILSGKDLGEKIV